MSKNWIAGAIKHPWVFSSKAKKANMSVAAYAMSKQHAKGTLGKQARLAMTLSKLRKRRKKA